MTRMNMLPSHFDMDLRSRCLDPNSLIECYFSLGFGYSEMLSFLFLAHGKRNQLSSVKKDSFIKRVASKKKP